LLPVRQNHAGIGMAIATLIETMANATARHSDNAPIASDAAIALVNRADATGSVRPPKPTVPSDLFII
jgi:hypothetical protein